MIRLSGPVAEQVGQAVVQCPGHQEWGSHRILYGHVMAVDGQRRLDEVLLLLIPLSCKLLVCRHRKTSWLQEWRTASK